MSFVYKVQKERVGLSIVELLVGLAIGSMGVLALAYIFSQTSSETTKSFKDLVRTQDSNSLFGFVHKNLMNTDTKTFLPVFEGSADFMYGQFPFFLANRCADIDDTSCAGDIAMVSVRNKKPTLSSVCLVDPLTYQEASSKIDDLFSQGETGLKEVQEFIAENPNARILVLAPASDSRFGHPSLIPDGKDTPVDWDEFGRSAKVQISNIDPGVGLPSKENKKRDDLEGFDQGVIDFSQNITISAEGKAYAFRPLPGPGKSGSGNLIHLASKSRTPEIGVVNIQEDPKSAIEAHLPQDCLQNLPMSPDGKGKLPTNLVAVFVEPLFLSALMNFTSKTLISPNSADSSNLDSGNVNQLEIFSLGFSVPALDLTDSPVGRKLVLNYCEFKNGNLDCPNTKTLFEASGVSKFHIVAKFSGALGAASAEIFRHVFTAQSYLGSLKPEACGTPNNDCDDLALPSLSEEKSLAPFLDYGVSPPETETSLQSRRWTFVKNRFLLVLDFLVTYLDGSKEKVSVTNQ